MSGLIGWALGVGGCGLRLHLAARGRLPWAIAAFLDDAHRLGVLRQVGAVYQFRHALLRDHLASVFHEAAVMAVWGPGRGQVGILGAPVRQPDVPMAAWLGGEAVTMRSAADPGSLDRPGSG